MKPEENDPNVQRVEFPEKKCRVCGCTDKDCRQCIAATGTPCYWVEVDLCSRCASKENDPNVQPVKLPAAMPYNIIAIPDPVLAVQHPAWPYFVELVKSRVSEDLVASSFQTIMNDCVLWDYFKAGWDAAINSTFPP